jgi:hypothetical protein
MWRCVRSLTDRPVGDSSLRALLLDVIEPGLDLAEDSVGVRAVHGHGHESFAVPIRHDGERDAGLEAESVHDALSQLAEASSVQLERHLPRPSRPKNRVARGEPLAKPIARRARSVDQRHDHLTALPPGRGTALGALDAHEEERDSRVDSHRDEVVPARRSRNGGVASA